MALTKITTDVITDDSITSPLVGTEFTTSAAVGSSATEDIDWTSAQIFTLTPSQSTTLNVTNPVIGVSKSIIVTGSGNSYTVALAKPAETVSYTGATVSSTATTISVANASGVNPTGGYLVGQTVTFGFTFTTSNAGMDFGLQGTTGTITTGGATGFTIASGNVGSVQTGTYVSGDITYSGNPSGTFNLISGEYDDTAGVKNLYSIMCVSADEFWYSISQIAV